MSSVRIASLTSGRRRTGGLGVEAQLGAAGERHHRRFVVQRHAVLGGEQPDGAVHRARVQIDVAEPPATRRATVLLPDPPDRR